MISRMQTQAAGGELGRLLRHWRDLRGKSQNELSLDTEISQRHLSFIESGRSVPSRPTLVNIAQALEIPLRERNQLFLAAGFAPAYVDDAWDASGMAAVRRALTRVLHQHEPFPAVVMDRYWNVLMTNEAAPRFFNAFVDLAARPTPRNMLHLMFDPAGMRPHIANWNSASKGLLERVRREAVGHVMDERTRQLMDELLSYPGTGDAHADAVPLTDESVLPVIPLSFIKHGQTLNYFSMVSTVGTPLTIAAQELRVECMFPMDVPTETLHMALMAATNA
ncbi:helix-turn-helix domain-containing protein [Pinirhizobacter soli]|uniref:helix-turn-helix domain-containing protein n=1 Tax=Pinirhizobacter soli TaxID=2786953 RepID=UPI002029BEFD